MEITPELAEICGMFAADGCMQEEYICMWGSIIEEKDYYDKYLAPLFKRTFNKNFNVHEKKSNSVYGFYLCSKKIVRLFSEFSGFPIGKKTYTVKVPNKIIKSEDPKIYAAFIRGFTDCDGTLNFLRRSDRHTEFERKFNTYPRIIITSVSKDIINQISYMLKRLNLKHTIYIKKKGKKEKVNAFIIAIRGKEKLEQWIKTIEFKNPSQSTKYEVWKKFGFCPPHTTVTERQKVLKGETNPYSYYDGQ